MNLDDKRSFYKSFFKGTVAGQELLSQMEAVELENISKAQDTNSLDFLSRSKGNREVIDLILNVLKTEKEVTK